MVASALASIRKGSEERDASAWLARREGAVASADCGERFASVRWIASTAMTRGSRDGRRIISMASIANTSRGEGLARVGKKTAALYVRVCAGTARDS